MHTMKDIKPTGNRVIILPDASQEQTEAGIFLPEKARKKEYTGVVHAVGGNLTMEPCPKPGDRVVYSSFGGTPFKIGDMDCLLLGEADILGIVVR